MADNTLHTPSKLLIFPFVQIAVTPESSSSGNAQLDEVTRSISTLGLESHTTSSVPGADQPRYVFEIDQGGGISSTLTATRSETEAIAKQNDSTIMLGFGGAFIPGGGGLQLDPPSSTSKALPDELVDEVADELVARTPSLVEELLSRQSKAFELAGKILERPNLSVNQLSSGLEEVASNAMRYLCSLSRRKAYTSELPMTEVSEILAMNFSNLKIPTYPGSAPNTRDALVPMVSIVSPKIARSAVIAYNSTRQDSAESSLPLDTRDSDAPGSSDGEILPFAVGSYEGLPRSIVPELYFTVEDAMEHLGGGFTINPFSRGTSVHVSAESLKWGARRERI